MVGLRCCITGLRILFSDLRFNGGRSHSSFRSASHSCGVVGKGKVVEGSVEGLA